VIVDQNGEVWETVASFFEDRSDVQCQHRWTKVVNPQLVKGPWTKEVSTFPFVSAFSFSSFECVLLYSFACFDGICEKLCIHFRLLKDGERDIEEETE